MTVPESSPPAPAQHRPRESEWGIGAWVVVFFVAFLFSTLVSVAVAAIGPPASEGENAPRAIVTGAALFPAALTAGAWFLFRLSSRTPTEILGVDRAPRDLVKDAGVGVAVGFGVQVGLAIVFSLLDYTVEQEIGRELERIVGPQLAALAVLVAVAAPVGEELFFRIALFDALRRRLQVTAAVVIQGVVFGLVHITPFVAVVALAAVGIVFGMLVARGRSVVAVIAAHMTFNAFAVAGLLSG